MRHGILAGALLAAWFIAGATHEAPVGGFVGVDSVERHSGAPAWDPSYAARFPGCREQLPEGVVPSRLVVVHLEGEVATMDFDRAWAVVRDESAANDVWVVGACR